MSSNLIEFVRGDNSTYKITVTNLGGSAYDLTGCTITLRVKTNRTDADGSALITKVSTNESEISIPTPTNGIAYIYFVPSDTSSLTVDNKYDYDIELTTVGGLKYTILRAHFKVLQD